ncbi:MAG: GGDEF domain-containing protein [Coriobacteriia bacterium]|nr:GGDEF domain-containing protein [Coriobacteriia bacterium]
MKPRSIDDSGTARVEGDSLQHVLGRSRKIKDAIKRAAGRLTSANAFLKRKKRASETARTVEEAMITYERVENEVAGAAVDLAQVNTELAVEVVARAGMESELADTKTDLEEARDDLLQSRANEHEAREVALHDTLTGLPNRALFDQAFDHGLIQARRHGWGLAVLFIDIDEFKSINDSHGHHVGDEVLLMVADRLHSFVRAEDMVSRWGGDEYVCLLLEVRQETDVARLAEKMVHGIAGTFESGGGPLSIGCSIGIAMYPADGETADTLLKNADAAMYRAKATEEKVAFFRIQ